MNLKEYIQGKRKGKDANRIERDALKDPFLNEALEGFDANEGDHVKQIEKLQKMITKKAASPVRRSWLVWGAAASTLLLVTFGGYFYISTTENNTPTLISQNIASEAHLDSSKEIQIIQDKQTEESKPFKEHVTEQEVHITQDKQAESNALAVEETAKEDKRAKSVKETVTVQKELSQNKSKATASSSQKKTVTPPVMVVLPTDSTQQDNNMTEIAVVVDTSAVKVGNKFLAGAEDVIAEQLSGRISGIAEKKSGMDSTGRVISGIVKDQYGEPVMFASILLKGTTIGTAANMDGRFEMKIDSVKSLNISSIGYIAQEIPVAQLSDYMEIILLEDQVVLSEAVVVGYGTARKSKRAKAASQTDYSKSEPVIGQKAFKQYLEDNMIHPVNERGKKIKGKVKLSFDISTQGRPYNITVEKSLNDAADAEAIRLINEGADWTVSNKKVEWTITF